MTAMTLFSLVFGEMADKMKRGAAPFGGLERMTLGLEDNPPGIHSTLITSRDGDTFRLTIEKIK